ncbi:GNAT family N-acetyltransferase [Bdellovibrio sp. HCB337]|uniref:GNAT family N-acetyltransferase n=1 Tax=Bdellovibrio sp. HCB337 TaxID=3394358 RepID=UPI0039A64BBC
MNSQPQNPPKNLPEMTLNFTLRTVREWREFLNQTQKTPWTQTFQYAIAIAKVAKQSTHMVTIDRGSQVVGLVAIQVSALGPFQSVTINRGPIWLKGQDTEKNMADFATALQKVYPKSVFRRFRWMPEWDAEASSTLLTEEFGLKKAQQSFETSWLNLTPTMEELRKSFGSQWRRHLSQAERSNIEVVVDTEGRHLDVFLRNYDLFKSKKNFVAPDAVFFKHEIETALPFKDAIILWARIDKCPIAGIVVMKHGTSASYRVGWNSPEGRDNQAHYLLVWNAIELLKKQSIETFDLGGILAQDQDTKGFNTFKLGLNGGHFKTEFFK